MTTLVLVAGAFVFLALVWMIIVTKTHWSLCVIMAAVYLSTALYIYQQEDALKGRPIPGLAPHAKYLVLKYAVNNNQIYFWLIDLKKLANNEPVEPETRVIPYNRETDKNMEEAQKQEEKTQVPNIIDMDAQKQKKPDGQAGDANTPNVGDGTEAGGETGSQLSDDPNATRGSILARPFEPAKDAPKR